MARTIHLELREEGEVFTIEGDEAGVRLHVDPPNRRNGCQNYDGWFGSSGRPYKRTQDAKAGLAKFLGLQDGWEDMINKGTPHEE